YLRSCPVCSCDLFFGASTSTDIYTLSLHDALPISFDPLSSVTSHHFARGSPEGCAPAAGIFDGATAAAPTGATAGGRMVPAGARSEEHTSELQSRENLVCRLLLEKKKQIHLAESAQ